MTVRLDKLEQALEDVLASVGVGDDQELITREQCLLFVTLAQGGAEHEPVAFERDFSELAEDGNVSRRRLIEMMVKRMREKGILII